MDRELRKWWERQSGPTSTPETKISAFKPCNRGSEPKIASKLNLEDGVLSERESRESGQGLRGPKLEMLNSCTFKDLISLLAMYCSRPEIKVSFRY